MLSTELPTRPEDLSVVALNQVIANHTPNVSLAGFEVVENHVWGGGQASSAGRIVIAPEYAPSARRDLPRHIVIKVAKSVPGQEGDPNEGGSGSGQLYANEVNVYNYLRPADFLEAPLTLGGAFDPGTKTFLLLMEDLRDRDAVFATMRVPTSIGRMRSLIEQLAGLHARYWNGRGAAASFDWLDDHTRGAIHDLFTSSQVSRFVEHQVATEQFKKEMLERLRLTPGDLFTQFQRVQKHQAGLPQTVCHGDMHIGNTYILPGDKGGLLDWQLTARGYCMHDISYIIATGLSIGDRRAHERDLLGYYRELLLAKGVAEAPTADELWLEYRRAMAWNVYIGWLITPVVNYGWEITVAAHLRTMTAYEDLETMRSLQSL